MSPVETPARGKGHPRNLLAEAQLGAVLTNTQPISPASLSDPRRGFWGAAPTPAARGSPRGAQRAAMGSEKDRPRTERSGLVGGWSWSPPTQGGSQTLRDHS